MIETETKAVRLNIPARPRINATESGDYESWQKRALIRYADIVRLVGEEPEDRPCERWGRASFCSRRPCEACEERSDWEAAILTIVREATDWGLWGSGHGCEGSPGRPYADNPSVYRHKQHPGVVVVSWGGGLDV